MSYDDLTAGPVDSFNHRFECSPSQLMTVSVPDWSLADALKILRDSIFDGPSKSEIPVLDGEGPLFIPKIDKPPVQLKPQSPAQTSALGRAMAWTGDWNDRALWCLY